MIKSRNIADYIDFLYRRKYGAAAPADVLQSWAPLPDDAIAQHLVALYQHWGMDAAEGSRYEQEFTGQHVTVTPTYVPPAYTPPPQPAAPSVAPLQTPPPTATQHVAAPRGGNPWKVLAVVLVLLVLAAGGYFAYQQYQNKDDSGAPFGPETTTTTTTATPTPAAPEPTLTKPEPMVAGMPMDDSDLGNVRNIQELLTAEDNQNMHLAMQYYSPYMQRYWDIAYPTHDQIEQRYQDSWSKISEPHNTVKDIKKIAPDTYDASISYSYFSLKDQKKKTVNSTVRFLFDSDGAITEVYGLK